MLYLLSRKIDENVKKLKKNHSSKINFLEITIFLFDCFGISLECMHAWSLQSCHVLCDPVDYSLPGSSVHVILQARILEWVAMPFSRGSSQPRDQTCISHIAGRFYPWGTWEAP